MIGHALILLGIVVLIVLKVRERRDITTLKKSVALKKLQVQEKILDAELNGKPDILSLMQEQGILSGPTPPGEAGSEQPDKDDNDDRTPVGFKK